MWCGILYTYADMLWLVPQHMHTFIHLYICTYSYAYIDIYSLHLQSPVQDLQSETCDPHVSQQVTCVKSVSHGQQCWQPGPPARQAKPASQPAKPAKTASQASHPASQPSGQAMCGTGQPPRCQDGVALQRGTSKSWQRL